jgi:hypothetical protein
VKEVGWRLLRAENHSIPVVPKVSTIEKDEAASVELHDSSWDWHLPNVWRSLSCDGLLA